MIIMQKLLDWIFYKKCYLCRKAFKTGLICEDCKIKIAGQKNEKIKNCSGIKIICTYPYKNEIQKILRGLKYHNKKYFAEYAAEILFMEYKNSLFSDKDTEIVPIPLFSERQKKRKYNQTELIANELSKMTGLSVNTDLVKRIKNTKPQYKLSRYERLENLKKAFKVNIEEYNGKKLLLLDDISTTGVTFEELIKELKRNNIKNIIALAVAYPY